MSSGSSAGNSPSAQLSPYLRPGELLLWSGRPDPNVHFTGADAFLIPFSIMWAGFAFFWESAAFRSGGPIFFKLWGIPFVAMGLYIVFGRFIGRIQGVNATSSASFSSGFKYPKVARGLPLRLR